VRRALAALGAGALVLGAVLAVRALRLRSSQLRVAPVHDLEVDGARAAERLAGALRFETVSSLDADRTDSAAFEGLSRYLEQSFPLVHARLQRERVGDHSLLFTWSGSDAALPPLLLLAHQDVVPVEPGTEGAWEHAPFAGEIAAGFVWGRGALDDKAGVVGILEAVEILLEREVRPRRTVVLAFGHDEEVGGARGAQALAARLQAAGLRFEFILDEGLAIVEGIIPGLDQPVALIGVAEKGYASVRLLAQAAGGHSSMPPRATAIGALNRALARLASHPLPARFDGVPAALFAALAPELRFGERLALSNLWLFRPLLLHRLAAEPTTDALVRTTAVPTMLSAGVKENVVPERAEALVNFRIRPGDSVAGVLEHVRRTVGDARVEVSLAGPGSEPSPVSSAATPGYEAIARAVREVEPRALVAPGLVLGGTDARHYQALSSAVYRFLPALLRPDDLPRVHGTNERIGVEDYRRVVRFYLQLLRRAAS
jgi:carboxypeptidase PM20D1